ncbi:hypothetical protein JD82_02672 [Prauserella rugosa]|uniref:Uncharacterized protein n=1 Tax=Prauserella rugosa TaxID=43354 RepID=A0A660CGN2_9PSEU|nr:hypothetical protein JD82_02672 [Prauserella rugosa]
MMSSPRTPTIYQPARDVAWVPSRDVRLRMKQEARPTGHVDGAWWPRSRDLSAELPALLAAVSRQWGVCERFTYNMTMWEKAARNLIVDGVRVRLDAFRVQPADIVTVVSGRNRSRLTLLVVPPESTPAAAHAALTAASQPGNTDSVDVLLGRSELSDTTSSTERWEQEGGRVPTD